MLTLFFYSAGISFPSISARISSRFGMAGAVPIFLTDKAAAALAKMTASFQSIPYDSPAKSPPLNASPAPVVSTAFTRNGGTIYPLPPTER